MTIENLKEQFKKLTEMIAKECDERGLPVGDEEFWTSHPSYVRWKAMHDVLVVCDEDWVMELLGL